MSPATQHVERLYRESMTSGLQIRWVNNFTISSVGRHNHIHGDNCLTKTESMKVTKILALRHTTWCFTRIAVATKAIAQWHVHWSWGTSSSVGIWMGDRPRRSGAVNLGPFVGVDLNPSLTVYTAVIVVTPGGVKCIKPNQTRTTT